MTKLVEIWPIAGTTSYAVRVVGHVLDEVFGEGSDAQNLRAAEKRVADILALIRAETKSVEARVESRKTLSREAIVQVALDLIDETVGLTWGAEALILTELALRTGHRSRDWLLRQEQKMGWRTVLLRPGSKDIFHGQDELLDARKPRDFNVGRTLGWSSYEGARAPSVIDIDTPDWRPVFEAIYPDPKIREVLERSIVLTPHGAHIYFSASGPEGRWKNEALPAMLCRSGHTVAPGSVVDGKLYEPLGEYKHTGRDALPNITIPFGQPGWGPAELNVSRLRKPSDT